MAHHTVPHLEHPTPLYMGCGVPSVRCIGSSMLLLITLLCVISLGEVAISSHQTSPYAVMACSRLVTMHVVTDTLWLAVRAPERGVPMARCTLIQPS